MDDKRSGDLLIIIINNACFFLVCMCVCVSFWWNGKFFSSLPLTPHV